MLVAVFKFLSFASLGYQFREVPCHVQSASEINLTYGHFVAHFLVPSFNTISHIIYFFALDVVGRVNEIVMGTITSSSSVLPFISCASLTFLS